jgi:DNA-binding NarL/FixJ family response regulator
MKPKIKIMLVDDHPLVREWLTNLINEEPDFEICGSASNTREAMTLLATLTPRIVVVDIALAGGSGLELIKDVKALHPKADTIVLSMHDEMLYAERAARAGAVGYIMKSVATDQVLEAIRTVLNGGLYFSNAVNALFAHKHVKGISDGPTAISDLSDREFEIYELLGRGHNPRQISEELHLGFKTVHGYCGRLREKLNLANLNELVFHAVRWHENQQSR